MVLLILMVIFLSEINDRYDGMIEINETYNQIVSVIQEKLNFTRPEMLPDAPSFSFMDPSEHEKNHLMYQKLQMDYRDTTINEAFIHAILVPVVKEKIIAF